MDVVGRGAAACRTRRGHRRPAMVVLWEPATPPACSQATRVVRRRARSLRKIGSSDARPELDDADDREVVPGRSAGRHDDRRPRSPRRSRRGSGRRRRSPRWRGRAPAGRHRPTAGRIAEQGRIDGDRRAGGAAAIRRGSRGSPAAWEPPSARRSGSRSAGTRLTVTQPARSAASTATARTARRPGGRAAARTDGAACASDQLAAHDREALRRRPRARTRTDARTPGSRRSSRPVARRPRGRSRPR